MSSHEGSVRTVSSTFVELKVRSWEEEPKVDPDAWRMRERMKTVSVAIVLCLNVGVDPPDVVRPKPCARLECWIDPQNISQQKAIEIIGVALQKQYERWQPRARYKLTFDPTVEEIRKMCISLRKNAKEERVLFHYNGHGVPKPTENGEIWVFNKSYTQYIPLSLFDLQTWMGSPGIYIWDCNGAGIAVNGFHACAKQHEKEYVAAKLQKARRSYSAEQSTVGTKTCEALENNRRNVDALSPKYVSGHAFASTPKMTGGPELYDKDTVDNASASERDDPEMPKFKQCIQLAACGAHEVLPSHPDLPADLFTCCLTTPVRASVLWYILNNRLTKKLPLNLVENIPGQLSDRRTPLGELNWIFTAITDTIAWNTLPQELFQRLFRQDLLVASLFRNFLLAQRIMRSYKCRPMSSPPLPETHDHVMWDAWDHTLDVCLSQLVQDDDQADEPPPPDQVVVVNQASSRQRTTLVKQYALENYVHSSFFFNQLTAFEVWLNYGFHNHSPPQQLPILLQVLLSQVHRLRALELLSRFLDLGPWAVKLALAVGIFPYVLRLLQSLTKELRSVLIFIWAKVLAVDNSCQVELVVHEAPVYFLRYMQDSSVSTEQRIVPAFVMAALVHDFPDGQRTLMCWQYVTVCSELLHECGNALLRQWLVLGLGCLWCGYDEAKWQAVRCNLHEKLFEMLNDPVPAVRASVAYALGNFMHDDLAAGVTAGASSAFSEQSTHLWHTITMTMVRALVDDGSAVVRRETLTALYYFILKFENQFVTIAYELYDERKANTGCALAEQVTQSTVISAAENHRHESFANLGDLSSLVEQIRRESSFSNIRSIVESAHDASSAITSPDHSPASGAAHLLANPRASMARLFGLLKHPEAVAESKSKSELAPFHDRKQRSRDSGVSGLSNVSNVYVAVWKAVLKFTVDPDYKISQLANRLVTYITDRVLNLRRSCFLGITSGQLNVGRRVTVGDVLSPISERRHSPARRAKFSVGAQPYAEPIGHDEVDGFSHAVHSPPTYSAYSIIYTSSRRPVFGHGPGSKGDENAQASASPSPPALAEVNAKGQPKKKALIETGFIDRCIQSFKLPIIPLLSGNNADCSSSTYPCTRQTLSMSRNDALLAAEVELQDQWLSLSNKEHCYNNAFTCRDSSNIRCLRFFTIDPMVCFASAYAVTIWNWESGTLVTKFDNDYCEESTSNTVCGQMVYVEIVNAETDGFLLTGTDHGVVRLWDAHALPDVISRDALSARKPTLLAAWNSTDNVHRHLRQAVTNYFWEQNAGLLFIGGDFRHVVVWNGHTEQKEEDLVLGTGSEVFVSSLSSDSAGNHLTAAGCSDGTVRLFDRRLRANESRIMTLRELEAPVCKVHVERASCGSRVLAVSTRGQVSVWDPRLFQEPVTLCQVGTDSSESPISAVDVHCQLPLIAAAVAGNQVNVTNLNGHLLATVRHHESFIGQKSGTIDSLNFHPMQVSFGIGESDLMFTMYN